MAKRIRRGLAKGDQKEAAILETAWRLLALKAPSAITIEELATGAGISRPAFYFYFDSREAVIRRLAEDTAGRFREITVDVIDPDLPPREIIRRTIAGLMDKWRTDGPILRAMNTLSETDRELRRFWDGIRDGLLDITAESIEIERKAGRALPGPPSAKDLAAALLAMQWRTGYESSMLPPSRTREAREVETLTEISLRAIYGSLDPPPFTTVAAAAEGAPEGSRDG